MDDFTDPIAELIRSRLPATIRTNNPGAMWMGPVARRFGATTSESLPGGNNAAVFPDPVSGAAAHFALLNSRYSGMSLSDAIAKWSGGNSSKAYTDFIGKQTGLAPDTVLTRDLLAGPQGMALAKAQSQWESGRQFPLTDDQWAQAQARGLGGAQAPATAPTVAPPPAVGPQPATPAPAFGALATPTAVPPPAPPAAPPPQAAGNTPGAPAGADPGAQLASSIPKILAALQQQNKPPPVQPLRINFPTPPGLARARQLAALMTPTMDGGQQG